MMITKCKDCFKDVSTSAVICPHCGAKLRSSGFTRLLLILFFIIVAFIAFIAIKMQFDPQHVRDARVSLAICEDNIGKSPLFTKEICEYKYQIAVTVGKQGVPVAAPKNHEAEAKFAEREKNRAAELKTVCEATKESIKKEYLALSRQGEWWKAGLKVWNCAQATNDPDFVQWGNEATRMNDKQNTKE